MKAHWEEKLLDYLVISQYKKSKLEDERFFTKVYNLSEKFMVKTQRRWASKRSMYCYQARFPLVCGRESSNSAEILAIARKCLFPRSLLKHFVITGTAILIII